jgi:hypothetical protein
VAEHGATLELAGMNRDFSTQTCKRTKLDVAAATAVRVPVPRVTECGNQGMWLPNKTKKVDALLCTHDPDDPNQIGLAAAPGIEWLYVNDDCVMQGGGWRSIPKDGSVMRARKN